MVESHPLPALAKTAAAMLVANFQRDVTVLGNQTREAMGLVDDPAWVVDFDRGIISREVPEDTGEASGAAQPE